MKKIVVLFGGKSSEHEVSILTGVQLLAVAQKVTDAVGIFIDLKGQWWLVEKMLEPVDFSIQKIYEKKLTPVCMMNGGMLYLKKENKIKPLFAVDVAINCCHGGYGENGGLVSFLNNEGVACSSGDGLAMQIAMDKIATKNFLRGIGTSVVDGFWLDKNMCKNRDVLFGKCVDLGFPLVIKPARQGSSVGVCFANDFAEVEQGLAVAFEFDDRVLIERGLCDFREFNVAVMYDGESAVVSEVEEPIRSASILSFEDKYLNGGKGKSCQKGMENLARKFPAKIDSNLKKQIVCIAHKVVVELGLIGICRLDFLYDGELFLNEINSVPGSLALYFWKEGKFETVKKLIEIAKKSFAIRSKKTLFESVFVKNV